MPGTMGRRAACQPQGARRDAGARAAARRVVGEGQRRPAGRRRRGPGPARRGPAWCRCGRRTARPSPRPTSRPAPRRARLRARAGARMTIRRRCRCGTTLPPEPPGRRGAAARPATATPTSPSSAPATPGSGPRYYLLRADPSLRVVVLEREVAGFGASGRNGGWCSALFPASMGARSPARRPDRRRPRPAPRDARDRRRGRPVAADEGIDCHFAKGGTVVAGPQRRRSWRAPGRGRRGARVAASATEDLRAARPPTRRGERLGATGVLGATYTPHCAAIHPARLVRGLAHAVERRGGVIHEGTPVLATEPGRVRTDRRHGAGAATSCAPPRAYTARPARPPPRRSRRSTR